MAEFSYSTTPGLRYDLKAFDDLRREIILLPISPKLELKVRWEARIKLLTALLSLTGYPFSKRDVAETVTSNRPQSSERAIIGRTHEAYSYIQREWFAIQKPITISAIETIVSMAFPKSTGLYGRRLSSHETAIRQLLEFIDNEKEHSLIRGAIGYIEMLRINPFDEDSTILASLLLHLVLSKSGSDYRGLVTPEVDWASDRSTYLAITAEAIKSANFTSWLNWIAQTSITTLEHGRDTLLTSPSLRDMRTAFFDLNERQKAILTILEEPDRKIANKDVQKRFKISQITASRDLAKMARLGLVYPRGKGRSVYYTIV